MIFDTDRLKIENLTLKHCSFPTSDETCRGCVSLGDALIVDDEIIDQVPIKSFIINTRLIRYLWKEKVSASVVGCATFCHAIMYDSGHGGSSRDRHGVYL